MRFNRADTKANGILIDGRRGEAYKRGPSEGCVLGGVLIEAVEKVEGMRGRRRWAAYGSRIECVRYGGPWMGSMMRV